MRSRSTTTRYVAPDSHSSSSAIFERDIEPISFHSSPLRSNDPHHVSRAQAHEPVEQSVPSVLSSAVSALSLSASTPASPAGGAYKRHSVYDDGEISVISPAAAASSANALGSAMGQSLMLSGMVTPRSVSRSPSPPATATLASTSQSQQHQQQQQQAPTGTTSPGSILTSSASRQSTSPRLADTTTPSPSNAFKLTTADTNLDAGEPSPNPIRVDIATLSSPIGGFVVGSGPIPRTRPSQTSLVTPVGIPGDFVADEALASGSPNNRLSFISYHVSRCPIIIFSLCASPIMVVPTLSVPRFHAGTGRCDPMHRRTKSRFDLLLNSN